MFILYSVLDVHSNSTEEQFIFLCRAIHYYICLKSILNTVYSHLYSTFGKCNYY